MMRSILIIIITLISSSVIAEQVYRSIGPDGSVVFSDKETPGSEPVEVKELPTVTLPKAPKFNYKEPEEEDSFYREVAIVSPQNDETIRENAGNISIRAAVAPPLSRGHILEITLDGKVVFSGSGTSVNLQNIDRGTHIARATVKDQSGKVYIASEPVTFHLLRHSIQHPAP